MSKMRKRAELPLGETARLTLEMDALQFKCCLAARSILAKEPADYTALQHVIDLHDALRKAHRVLDNATMEILTDRQQRQGSEDTG